MRTHNVERESITGRQIAFEIAAQITAAVGIMIGIVRRLYVAILFTVVTIAVSSGFLASRVCAAWC